MFICQYNKKLFILVLLICTYDRIDTHTLFLLSFLEKSLCIYIYIHIYIYIYIYVCVCVYDTCVYTRADMFVRYK